ncbi:hypothetical protein Tco_0118529, partial [Tanacetum coccineum]
MEAARTMLIFLKAPMFLWAEAVATAFVLKVTSISTTIDQDAPSTSISPSFSEVQPLVFHQGVADGPNFDDNPLDQAIPHLLANPIAGELSSAVSSSRDACSAE